MTPTFLDRIDPSQRRQLRNIALGYFAWVMLSIFAWCFLLPEWLLWIAYLPVLFAMLVVFITILAIILKPILPKPIQNIYIGHKRITCCQFCPMADIKDNIVNNSYPVVKCRETAKVCYNPRGIPRWCPYAD